MPTPASPPTGPEGTHHDLRAGSALSRRHLLLGGLGLGAVPALLSACGGSSASSTDASSSAGATAKAGGTMRIARPPASSAETLDPATSLSAYEYLGALYNRLIKQAKDGSLAPDLATHWTGSADALTWTFTMRKGVTFHDGKAFTARDAAYTLAHILDPAVASPQAAVLSTFLTPAGLAAPADDTLVVTLNQPNAEFPSLLVNYNCYVIPDGSAGTIGSTGIGTGPFKLKSFAPAGKGVVVANTSYFGGSPKLDSIEFTAIADTQARVNALLAGQVDLVTQTNLDVATAKTVQASSTNTTATVKNATWYVLPMLFTASPFTNNDVRTAFKLAYDPKDLMALAVGGKGTIAHNNPVLPSDPYYLDYTHPHDPEKAASLLSKAGVSPLDQILYTSAVEPVLSPLALAFKGSVAKAKIDISVKTAAADSYYTDVWMKQPIMTSYWSTGRPIDQLLNQIFRSGAAYNESKWANPQFDGLLDSARKEMDQAKRKTLYQDAQKLIVDDGSTLSPFFADRTTGLSKKVVGYSEHGFEFDYVGIGLSA